MTHEEIINQLKNHRKSLGITLTELADRVGIRAATICEIETGKRTPTLATFMKIAEALGMEVTLR